MKRRLLRRGGGGGGRGGGGGGGGEEGGGNGGGGEGRGGGLNGVGGGIRLYVGWLFGYVYLQTFLLRVRNNVSLQIVDAVEIESAQNEVLFLWRE